MTKRNQLLEAVSQLKKTGVAFAAFTTATYCSPEDVVTVDSASFKEMFAEGSWELYKNVGNLENIIYTQVAVKLDGLTVTAMIDDKELADAKGKGLLKEAE